MQTAVWLHCPVSHTGIPSSSPCHTHRHTTLAEGEQTSSKEDSGWNWHNFNRSCAHISTHTHLQLGPAEVHHGNGQSFPVFAVWLIIFLSGKIIGTFWEPFSFDQHVPRFDSLQSLQDLSGTLSHSLCWHGICQGASTSRFCPYRMLLCV